MATVLLKCSAEAADECVEAAPGLSKWAGAGHRWVWVAEEGAARGVDLGLSELVQVAEELQNMSSAAARECEWRAVVV